MRVQPQQQVSNLMRDYMSQDAHERYIPFAVKVGDPVVVNVAVLSSAILSEECGAEDLVFQSPRFMDDLNDHIARLG